MITFILLLLLFFLATAIRFFFLSSRSYERATSYKAVPAFLSPAERSFFGVLQQTVGADYWVFAKVRLADIIQPTKNLSRSGWRSSFNRISAKHVDFVICDLKQLNIMSVVELDDQTHKRFDRGIRDVLVDSALKEAGITVLRVSARQTYAPAQLREQLNKLITSKGNGESSTSSRI